MNTFEIRSVEGKLTTNKGTETKQTSLIIRKDTGIFKTGVVMAEAIQACEVYNNKQVDFRQN